MSGRTHRESRFVGGSGGFSLVELLVVVAVIAILMAIAIPNLLNAISRSRQKRTVADMRQLAVAWEARATDRGSYNAAGDVFEWPNNAMAQGDLQSMLTPTYIRAIPTVDGWSNPFELAMDQPYPSPIKSVIYSIRSAGSDGVMQATYSDARTTSFDCDIVYSNGTFVVGPQGGVQK